MRSFWILLRREITSRWLLFAASLAMGFFVAILPAFTAGPSRPEEIRGAAAVGTATTWAALLALGLGATCLARDLGERRLAFDFRLPVSAQSIWAARLLGAYLTAVLSALVLLAPPSLAGIDLEGAAAGLDVLVSPLASEHPSEPIWMEGVSDFAPMLLAGLFLLANVGGLALFGRRGWSACDLASAALALTCSAWAVSQFQLWVTAAPIRALVPVVSATLLAGLVVASFRQVRRGATEPDVAHRAFSTTFGGAALLAGVSCIAFPVWYLHPSLGALDSSSVALTTLGDRLVEARGIPRGRDLAFRFVIDPRSGKWRRLGPAAGFEPNASAFSPRLSADGSALAWFDASGEVSFANLARLFARPRHRYLPPVAEEARLWLSSAAAGFSTAHLADRSWATVPAGWSLSPDGKLLAHLMPGGAGRLSRLVVEELTSGAVHASFDLRECDEHGPLVYLSASRLQASCGLDCCITDAPQVSDLREIHLPTLTVLRYMGYPGGRDTSGRWVRYYEVSRGTTLLSPRSASDLTRQWRWRFFRLDEPTAALPIDPPLGVYPREHPSDALFLPDGGVLLTLDGDRDGIVVRYDASGRARWIVPLAENHLRISSLSGSDGEGVAVLEAEREVYERKGAVWQFAERYRRALAVNLVDGEVRVLPGLSALERPASRGTEALVERDPDGSWVWTHLRTGERHPLPIGRHARAALLRTRSTGGTATFLAPVEY